MEDDPRVVVVLGVHRKVFHGLWALISEEGDVNIALGRVYDRRFSAKLFSLTVVNIKHRMQLITLAPLAEAVLVSSSWGLSLKTSLP